MGDGEFKLWVSYGCYYLFVVVNINICLVGVEIYIQEYYEFEGFVDEVLGILNLIGV